MSKQTKKNARTVEPNAGSTTVVEQTSPSSTSSEKTLEVSETAQPDLFSRFGPHRMEPSFYSSLDESCFPTFSQLINDVFSFAQRDILSNDALGTLGSGPLSFMESSMSILSSIPAEVPEEIIICNTVLATFANQNEAHTSEHAKTLLTLINAYLDFCRDFVPSAPTENLSQFLINYNNREK